MRMRQPPSSLRIDTPPQNSNSMIIPVSDSAPSSDSDFLPSRSTRNLKKLSISSTSSLIQDIPIPTQRHRRPSVASLPALRHRKDEELSPTVPYLDGPTQIIPGIWLGSEDNARDWKGLIERGIRSILNVAKEVVSPFDSAKPVKPFASTPNLKDLSKNTTSTYYPAHLPSGRPSMHYLKLQWSHGQQDLVRDDFPIAMAFTDAALERGEGVLIHCQCGISRSATMVIALVMRAAAQSSPLVPPEVWALKGMHAAYAYVKEKSQWVGPNMSLIYQLLEYERVLHPENVPQAHSEKSSLMDEEDEWGRQRRALDESPSGHEDTCESVEIMREARALDKAMEDRIVARKSSTSSIASSSGVGMGSAWRSRYGGRKRTGSVASNATSGSILSEDLVEEDEEQELLGVGGGFDDTSISPVSFESSPEPNVSPAGPKPVPKRAVTHPPPSAPPGKTSFSLTPRRPATVVKPCFEAPPLHTLKLGKRQNVVHVLPSVPGSPIAGAVDQTPTAVPNRIRTQSRKPAPPPLHLRKPSNTPNQSQPISATPSQTLFLFPPSPTFTTRTPSTMTLTSNLNVPVPFPSSATPRVATFRSQGRTKSFIGLGMPPTPTTACSRVDARGWIGLDVSSAN